jgi:hypothetical protein
MPTLSDLRRRTSNDRPAVAPSSLVEEAMVADQRSRLRPAQIVEQKLRTALGRGKVPRDGAAVLPEVHV